MGANSNNSQEMEGGLERFGKWLDNLNIWWKRLGVVVAIIAATGGACIGITTGVTNILDQRIAEQVNGVSGQIDQVQQVLEDTRLDTLRSQLMLLIYHQPMEHSTILEVAHEYFVVHNGNWVMSELFIEWASTEHVNIPPEILYEITNE